MIKTLEGPPTAPPVGPKTTHSPKTRADRDDVPDGWTACPVPAGIPPSVGTAQAAYAHDASGAIVVMGTPPQSDDDEGGHDCDAMGCGSVGAHILWRCAKPGRPVTALVAEARRLVEKMRTGAGGWGPLTDEMLNTMSTLADRVEQLEREAEARRMSVDGFSAVVDAAARHARRPRGGQQVPFHGDFAGAGPSVVTRLEWWARTLREAAPDPWHPASEPPVDCERGPADRIVLVGNAASVVQGYRDRHLDVWVDGESILDPQPTHWRELPAGPAGD